MVETPAPARHDPEAVLGKSVRRALEEYLKGRRLVRVQIRHVEGNKTEGFLKIEGNRGERTLVDFKAVSARDGGLSSLEVGGNKILLDAGPAVKRTRSRQP